MRPIGIDLFAGAGGMSLGFEQAGFDIVAAGELDPLHCAVHKLNFPHCAVMPRSVVDLTGSEIRVAAGIGKRKVDVVFGGAPGQGSSMIGQRALDDPRNALVRDFLRIVAELDATYFVFENVKGLTLGRHRQFLDEIVATADELGYDVLSPWRVLDAAHFGVPQHRERLFLYGAKRSKTLPSYPHQTTGAADGRGKASAALPIGPNAFEALSDIPVADFFEALSHTDEVRPDTWADTSVDATEFRCLTNDAWHYGYVRQWDPSLLTSSARTEHTDISRRRFSATTAGDTEPVSRFYKLSPNGLSNTLRAGTDGARGAFTSPRPIHYAYDRCITVREMARLHGFPDWFRLHATKWHGARQIGNAVQPPLARAIGSEIVKALGLKPKRPFETLDLGDTALLRMNLSQAADHFGVTAMPSKRDRKSGATKRKQAEIEAMSHIEKRSLYA